MRAVQVFSPGDIKIVDVDEPAVSSGFALIKPEMITVCGSDLRQVYSLPENSYPLEPGVSGHEIIGIIERVIYPDKKNITGSEDTLFKEGDRVLALLPEVENGMAEKILARIEHLVLVPIDWPVEQLLMAQQLGTVIYACKQLDSVLSKTVAVIGQGSAGLFFVSMLKRLGVAKIIAMDLIDCRVSAAKRAGATTSFNNETIDPKQHISKLTNGRMVDIVIEAVGTPAAVNLAPRLVRSEGEILFFGVPKQNVFPVDFGVFFRSKCRAKSIYGAGKELGMSSIKLALELIINKDINVANMVTHVFSLSEAKQAYELAHSPSQGAFKIGVVI